jgi:hypothetical protein
LDAAALAVEMVLAEEGNAARREGDWVFRVDLDRRDTHERRKTGIQDDLIVLRLAGGLFYYKVPVTSSNTVLAYGGEVNEEGSLLQALIISWFLGR